ncbi:hypothetical protein [Citrifermentans bremense]|uniref:hypothetical protein n=1 Tax=Citrifermentans bremense TaxID=60035 RepID=UPI0012ECA7FA|nr:hypothetical protein [Citrifermentans bremense]
MKGARSSRFGGLYRDMKSVVFLFVAETGAEKEICAGSTGNEWRPVLERRHLGFAICIPPEQAARLRRRRRATGEQGRHVSGNTPQSQRIMVKKKQKKGRH